MTHGKEDLLVSVSLMCFAAQNVVLAATRLGLAGMCVFVCVCVCVCVCDEQTL